MVGLHVGGPYRIRTDDLPDVHRGALRRIIKPTDMVGLYVGGPYRIRTDDLLVANEAL